MEKNTVGMDMKIITKINNMNGLISFTKSILAFSSGFHVGFAVIWLISGQYEKSMNRADFAIVFFALYVILRRVDKNV